jgi:hypothetical protein
MPRRLNSALPLLAALAFLLAGAGCSTRHAREGVLIGLLTPQPPAFLTGPMAVLLTNTCSYSARVNVETNWRSNPREIRSGSLLARDGKLMLAVDPDPSAARKSAREATFLFIWDVAAGQGFLLSEALQGYAPIATNTRCTEVTLEPTRGPAQKIDGHTCQRFEAAVKLNDGSTAQFHVWRAPALKDFPLHIAPAGDATVPGVKFSRVRFATVPLEMFSPPDGFTRYESTQALMTELVARQRNLVLKPKGDEPVNGVQPRDNMLTR